MGGQAGVTFAKEALTIIGKEGFNKGIMTILKGVLGGGVKAAGATGTAGAGGGIAAASSALLASNPVGWAIAAVLVVAAAAVVVWKTVIAPVLNGVKNFLQKNLNIDLNRVKSFIAEDLGLGKVCRWGGTILFDVGLFLVGLPALPATINFTAVIAPVFIFLWWGCWDTPTSVEFGVEFGAATTDRRGNCVLKSETEKRNDKLRPNGTGKRGGRGE